MNENRSANSVDFFAGWTDTLTAMSVYYMFACVFLVSEGAWGVGIGWLLLCATVSAFFYHLFLKKPRIVTLLAAVTVVFFAVCFAFLLLVSETSITFGYGFVIAIGAGMAVGVPLYFEFNRPNMLRHLTHIDAGIASLLFTLICRESMQIPYSAPVFMVAVLVLTLSGAVGLRMNDNASPDTASAMRAVGAAFCGGVVLAAVAGILVALLSRSGGATGAVIEGIGRFFSMLGHAITRFVGWLVSLFPQKEEDYSDLELESNSMTTTGGSEEDGIMIDPAAVAITITVIVIIVLALTVYVLRKTKLMRARRVGGASAVAAKRTSSPFSELWKRFVDGLKFRITAFKNRNTPAGLLVWLERRAGKCRKPRRKGETFREFIGRMDISGKSDELADALDLAYYAGVPVSWAPAKCRSTRKHLRKCVKREQRRKRR